MSETNVNIGLEQILATILHKIGPVTVSTDELMANYSQYAIAVDPSEEGVVLSLVDLQGVDLEEISE